MKHVDLRLEHPRPDAVRDSYVSLNGAWDFEIDNDLVGIDKRYMDRMSLDGKITVPFCPESKLSGVENTDCMKAVWYRRDLSIPREWNGKRILLHIGACDYETHVYVNGKKVGSHKGGYTPFSFDIAPFIENGGNYVTVYAKDDTRSSHQVRGKQSPQRESFGCLYTRTTGIWQSVWLEAMDRCCIERYEAVSDTENSTVILSVECSEAALGADICATVCFDGKEVGKAKSVERKRVCSYGISFGKAPLGYWRRQSL